MTASGHSHFIDCIDSYATYRRLAKCISNLSLLIVSRDKIAGRIPAAIDESGNLKEEIEMKTINAGFVRAVATFGIVLISIGASASAGSITYNTNAAGTGFAGGGLTLNGTNGASLVFTPRPSTTTGTPSNVNFGIFTLFCAACTSQPTSGTAGSATFGSFTFNLVFTDQTDGGVGRFVGSSTGGMVYRDVSPINISWVPLVLGPLTNNALSGTFGPTIINILGETNIVAPNSGVNPGQTTVEGRITSRTDIPALDGIPEPGTMALIGAGLIGVRLLARKN